MSKCAVFIANLLQDVNILRPLIYMASNDLNMRTICLATNKFIARDKFSIWRNELEEISADTNTPVHVVHEELDVVHLLEGKSGVIIAASESNLPAHAFTHNIFKVVHPGFLKVTLQHGFECVGFLHSYQHDVAYGKNVYFNADVICGWLPKEKMLSMLTSQSSKLYTTGSTSILQLPREDFSSNKKEGLICENLHSVRLNVSADLKVDFIDIFDSFCKALKKDKLAVTLRLHPGGQYILKNKVELPDNVTLNNAPMYKLNLKKFAYGISAPSSVLIDMVLAGIPVAVWRDNSDIMDTDNYSGLETVCSLEEWVAFSKDALENPQKYLSKQNEFLSKLGLSTDPAKVYDKFAQLLSAFPVKEKIVSKSAPEQERVMFIANANIPTLQLCFEKPLSPLVESGSIETKLISELELNSLFGRKVRESSTCFWLEKQLEDFSPSILVFCRYSGPHAEYISRWARQANIPVIFHIDDDLLNVPKELGEKKFKAHNHPDRLSTVRYLLGTSDLVYASTEKLKNRFLEQNVENQIYAGKINCSGEVLVPASLKNVKKIGYMGFDHAHDLDSILPALIEYLERFENVEFELFGSIPKPKELDRFAERIKVIPPVRDYSTFMQEFAKREWDIGICPLADTGFNHLKSNNKWVEYTSVNTAVIATVDKIYDEVCADGCGILAKSHQDWLDGLSRLTEFPEKRFEQVKLAQEKLIDEYSVDVLQNQVLNVFKMSKEKIDRK